MRYYRCGSTATAFCSAFHVRFQCDMLICLFGLRFPRIFSRTVPIRMCMPRPNPNFLSRLRFA